MPDRRFRFAELLAADGLPAPDEATMTALWQIVDEGVLGASRHVALSHALLVRLGQGADGRLPADRAWRVCRRCADFIAETRGLGAPVVANAIAWLMAGAEDGPLEDRGALLAARAAQWRDEAAARQDALVAAAAARLADARGVLAYDYSSTVAAVVLALHAARDDLRVVVPESRAIAGGRRFLDVFVPRGMAVRFLPDAAFEQGLADVSAVLMGAESLRADGAFVNTVGSRPLARLARLMGVEVFACADLFKLDLRSYAGATRPFEARSFDEALGLAGDGADRVDTRCFELEVVPPEMTTALLTEHGPVPPPALWTLGREVFDVPAPGAAP